MPTKTRRCALIPLALVWLLSTHPAAASPLTIPNDLVSLFEVIQIEVIQRIWGNPDAPPAAPTLPPAEKHGCGVDPNGIVRCS